MSAGAISSSGDPDRGGTAGLGEDAKLGEDQRSGQDASLGRDPAVGDEDALAAKNAADLEPSEELTEQRRSQDPRMAQLALRRSRSALLAIALAVTGPMLAVATYAVLSQSDAETLNSVWFKALILADVCYLVVLASLIGLQIARLWMAQRARSAGSRLHARMVAVFTGVAAAPAIMVAIFFFLVMQLGFEAWFSDQVASVVRNSRDVAQAYAREHRDAIEGRAVALATELSVAAQESFIGARDPRFRATVDRATAEAGFSDVYVVNSSGRILVQGRDSFLFTYTSPSREEFAEAQKGAVVISQDSDAGEMRALVRLDSMFDAFLYVTRPVDGEVLVWLERTKRGVLLYNRLERNRDAWLAQFAVLYLGFVVLVLVAAIYLGLWFAERLARPIGRLAAAAQRVRSGDLVVRVKEERSDDEIALLSRVFNRMTEEVKRKQDAITDAKEESERRRLFSEAVLLGVSAGVVGLDADGRIRLLNRSAARLLALSAARDVGRPFVEAAPEFADLFADAAHDPTSGVERPIRVTRGENERELLARITIERVDPAEHGEMMDEVAADHDGVVGYVVTLDDLTALVSAQRMAAWGDVARRIAHEIKNPLTPIQLAAERLRRKYSHRLGEDAEAFDRYTETIVRQTGDIGRMVDAFVRFAKLPAPVMAVEELPDIVREAMLLQEEARSHIAYHLDLQEAPGPIRCDRGQILQALTNLLQNSADSLQARIKAEAADGVVGAAPEIRLVVGTDGPAGASVEISDNGVGLPQHDRRKLLEPYVTTREKGAGLGLAIVLKIIEEHGGAFELEDAEPFADGAAAGARARIRLPIFIAPPEAQIDDLDGDDLERVKSARETELV